jgi:phosphoesterase RecJ-like protein
MLGEQFPSREVTGTLISLDHHASGKPFADIHVCDPTAASVGVLVARLADRLGWTIEADAAAALYVTLISDTGGFRHANTSAEALHLAGRLVERGADPYRIGIALEERTSLARARLLAAALQSLELVCDGRAALMTITAAMVASTGATWDDTEGMVMYARGIDKVACGVLLTTARGGGVRVSMRAHADRIDVGAVCQVLGGGGHAGAAGCLFAGDIPAARSAVIAALDSALPKREPPR